MASEITSVRNVKLAGLIAEVGGDIADLVAWPDSEATKLTADNSIKLLRKAFKEAGYPHNFLYMAMLQIAADAYSETVNRDNIRVQSLKAAWIKIADLLQKD